LGDQSKKNEMDRSCSTYGGGEVHIGIFWGDMREGQHLEDPGTDGTIILK